MYVYLTIKDLFNTLSDECIKQLFFDGLVSNNVVESIAAFEELMLRKRESYVRTSLVSFLKNTLSGADYCFFFTLANVFADCGDQHSQIGYSPTLGKVGIRMGEMAASSKFIGYMPIDDEIVAHDIEWIIQTLGVTDPVEPF